MAKSHSLPNDPRFLAMTPEELWFAFAWYSELESREHKQWQETMEVLPRLMGRVLGNYYSAEDLKETPRTCAKCSEGTLKLDDQKQPVCSKCGEVWKAKPLPQVTEIFAPLHYLLAAAISGQLDDATKSIRNRLRGSGNTADGATYSQTMPGAVMMNEAWGTHTEFSNKMRPHLSDPALSDPVQSTLAQMREELLRSK